MRSANARPPCALITGLPARGRAAQRETRFFMPLLVLLRHGQSQWNLENRFTGWVDVDLSPQGEAEARRAGALLKEAGLEFDGAFTSVLTRAIRTMNLALEATG